MKVKNVPKKKRGKMSERMSTYERKIPLRRRRKIKITSFRSARKKSRKAAGRQRESSRESEVEVSNVNKSLTSSLIYRHIYARQFSRRSITCRKGSQLWWNLKTALMRMPRRALIFFITITRKKITKEKKVETDNENDGRRWTVRKKSTAPSLPICIS